MVVHIESYFPQSKRECSEKILIFPAWHFTNRFPLGGGPDKEELFALSDQSIRAVSYETKQVSSK